MYQKKLSAYVKNGLIAGFIITVLANVMFIILGLLLGHEIGFIGQDRDTLYIVFISFATFMAVFLSSMIFYLLQKYTKKPILWFIFIVLIGFLFNTYTAEVDLQQQFKITAHILHFIVSGLALYIVPKLLKSK